MLPTRPSMAIQRGGWASVVNEAMGDSCAFFALPHAQGPFSVEPQEYSLHLMSLHTFQ